MPRSTGFLTSCDAQQPDPVRLPLLITGGGTLVTGNHFVNVLLVVEDRTTELKLIHLGPNLLEHSIITHRRGRLVVGAFETGRE